MKKILLILLFSLLLCGCNSWIIDTPDYILPEEISYDNGVQNAGVLGISSDGKGFIVSKNLIDRYNAMMDFEYVRVVGNEQITIKYKNLFIPPIEKNEGVINIDDKTFFIDNQAYSKFLFMNGIRQFDLRN